MPVKIKNCKDFEKWIFTGTTVINDKAWYEHRCVQHEIEFTNYLNKWNGNIIQRILRIFRIL